MAVRQDARGWTHVDWELEGVTPRMIDWFWSNMEKGFLLWHPAEHFDFHWVVKPKGREFIGCIHIAPQRWSDGTLFEPHIRFDDVAGLTEDVADVIVYDHVVVAVGIALARGDYKPDNPPLAYRIHQWEKTDAGVRGMSSAIPVTSDPMEVERGLIWAKHAAEEVAHWQDFLPELYRLFRVVRNPEANPFFPLKVERNGRALRYVEE